MRRVCRLGTFAGAFLLLFACQTRSTDGANVAFPSGLRPTGDGTTALDGKLDGADETKGLSSDTSSSGATDYDTDGEELDEVEGDDEATEVEPDPAAVAHGSLAHTAREPTATPPHPLDALSQAELERRLSEDPRSLGSVSLGRPNAGALFNGVLMPEDEAWVLVDPRHAFGTQETVDALSNALRAVSHHFPGTAAVPIGHLSAKAGGHLRPHRSHQSGRDVDLGFYFREGAKRWYARATPGTLDLERTVFFLCALLDRSEIEMVLVDQSLHEPLRTYAEQHGVDENCVTALFRRSQGRLPIVRHAPGHATHLHLRFRNPTAQRSGVRLATLLAHKKLVPVPPKTVVHVARSGDTLAKLATRYRTTMRAIRVHNRMPNTALVAGRAYQIPVTSASREHHVPPRTTASVNAGNTSKK